MSDYHESYQDLPEKDRNIVRGLHSLREEIEAIDWYHQRVAACREEGWDEELRTYLFSEGPIAELEE
jgi:hypothetical protein